jgi:hypothetical protein
MALKEGKRGSTGPSLDGFKIVLLQGAGVQALEGKKKYESAYDVVVVSNLVAHTLKREYGCQSILKKPHSVVVCEGADYMLNLDKEEKKGFADKIAEFGRGLGCHIEAGKERVPGGTHLGVPLPLYRLVYDDEKAGKIVDEWAEEERVKKEKEEKEGGKRRGKSDGEVEGGALGEVLGDKAVEQVGGGDDDGEIIEVKATSKNGSSEKADAKPPPGVNPIAIPQHPTTNWTSLHESHCHHSLITKFYNINRQTLRTTASSKEPDFKPETSQVLAATAQ